MTVVQFLVLFEVKVEICAEEYLVGGRSLLKTRTIPRT
jgi:hypothetical protein